MLRRGGYTLVKYQRPLLKPKADEEQAWERTKASTEGYETCRLPSVNKEDEDNLDDIIPPREFEIDDGVWIQYVSRKPATRMDAINLQDKLRSLLVQRYARETGICAVRRELYNQCYDEVIRQVAVHCPERGILLSRLRDEWRMTLAAYQALYESSVAYGIQKAEQAKQEEAQMEETIRRLYIERDELRRLSKEIDRKCQRIERSEIESRDSEEKRQAQEVEHLRKINQTLKDQLEVILSARPKGV